jgi:polyhydroxybutyrate depolymerase
MTTRATCGDRSAVDVHVVEGAGHVWFGAASGELADPKPVIDATDVMWDFFAAHPRIG